MSWQYLAGSGGNNIPAWHDGGDATPYSPVATAIDRPIFTAGDCMPIFRVAVRACPKEYRTRRAGSGARKHARSEEHTSELQSLMRISYAVFCLKKKKT